MTKRHVGSSLDDFLKEEGIFEETHAQAIKEVAAWRLAEAMKARSISKARMATLLKSSRSQVDKLLWARWLGGVNKLRYQLYDLFLGLMT
jgi:antitoxin HicB